MRSEPFRAIEESTLAHLSPAALRPHIFAWYSLIGNAGTAFGMMTCGCVVHALQSKNSYDDVRAYRIIFFAYALLGGIKLALALSLSKKCELERHPKPPADPERTPLLANGNGNADHSTPKPEKFLFPKISKETRGVFLNLAILFALDAFGSGLAPLYVSPKVFPSLQAL